MTDSRLELWNLICQNEYLKSICRLCEDGTIYLESRVDEIEGEDVGQDEYDIIREELECIGLQLVDPLVEHDCVSGDVGKLT